MESPDGALKSHVADVLGQIQSPRAIHPLLAALVSPASTPQLRMAAAKALGRITNRVPTAEEASRLLEASAQDALERSRRDEETESRTLWHWNARQQQSMPIVYDATGASLAEAVRLARVLRDLDPTSASRRRLYLTTLLQAAKFRTGLDKPLPAGKGTARAVAEQHGADAVGEVLAGAMLHGYAPAATAAAEILGDMGDPASLVRAGAAPSPLAAAAGSADRRLRFAAMNAILKLNPAGPFTGSSYVADGLGYFASSYGMPRVLVVHPRSEEAQSMAGLANALGYEADTATNGRRAFELASHSPDYEIILIHSAIDRPRADELVAQLRRDRRTAAVPIGLIATLDDRDRVRRFARAVPMAEAFLQPQREEEMKLFCEQLAALSGRDHVSTAERKAQAAAALDWLQKLSGQSQAVFDVRRQEPAIGRVLYVPELSAAAATVLGNLGTASSQSRLLELAGSATQPLAARQAAADAFGRSVRKYGILLSREQIMAQYDLYNANAGRHGETHEVLGKILDALENRGEAASSP
jgi:CheY-like chemotaxis protein